MPAGPSEAAEVADLPSAGEPDFWESMFREQSGLASLVSAAPVPAPAPEPVAFYLKIDGLVGGSTSKGHEGWFELPSFVLGLGNNSVGGGAGAVSVPFQDLRLTPTDLSAITALLARHAYPALDAHRALHRDFLGQLEQISASASLKSFKTSQVLKLMQGWLVKHVTEEDQRYGAFISG